MVGKGAGGVGATQPFSATTEAVVHDGGELHDHCNHCTSPHAKEEYGLVLWSVMYSLELQTLEIMISNVREERSIESKSARL